MGSPLAHDPTPWHADKGTTRKGNNTVRVIYSDDGAAVAFGNIWTDAKEAGNANTDHIVLCVNSHDALVKALDGLLDLFGSVIRYNRDREFVIAERIDAGRAALQSAMPGATNNE